LHWAEVISGTRRKHFLQAAKAVSCQ